MTSRSSTASRRRFIKITATGFAAAMLGTNAHAVDAVTEADPTAAALKYKMDATKAAERKDKTAFCENCALYTGKAGAADGPCGAFAGKLVKSKGWCTAWSKKA
jgi:High potential iron-sulfur protein